MNFQGQMPSGKKQPPPVNAWGRSYLTGLRVE